MPWIVAWIAAAVTLMGLEALWLGLIARGFYARAFGEMLLTRPILAAAAAFYALMAAGVVLFAVAPGVAAGSWARAALLGGALGVVAYGVYDFTNLATLKGFPARVVAPDIAWGAVVCAAAAAVGWLAASRFR